jgi:DNA-binding NarL/FixJ family response regulator/DNA-binding winged helix-turn-helix (wHTH) protein
MDPSLKNGFRLGNYRIDPLSGEVNGPDGVEHVQPKVMDVLLCLIEHRGKLVERDAIIERVWGRATSEEALTRCISELRSALGDDRGTPRYIQTVPKRGYRLLQPVVPLAFNEASASGDEGTRPFTVLLVDDHALFREGLKLQLEELDESIVCLEAGTCEEALALAPRTIDLVLLDYGLPGVHGLEAIAKIKRAFAAPVTVVSANDDAPTIRSAIANGAVGFIPKSMSKREFFAALGLVRAGAIYLPPQVLFGSRQNEASEMPELQRRLLAAIIGGKNDAAIAAELGLNETDLETEIHRAYRALGVDNRVDAVYELAKRGIRLA